MQITVDTKAIQEHARRLERISRSALPVAIRETLNDAAKDMKTNTMLAESKKAFINRTDNFFKANSSYDRAEGFSVESMKSTLGMTEKGLKGNDNYSVKDLEDQETGGTIEKRAFIPMLGARKGGARTLVRANARLQKIKNVVKASTMGFSSPKSNFIVAAHKAGVGGHFLSKNVLWRVNKLNPTKSNDMNLTPLYSYKPNRKVKVGSHHFIERSGKETQDKMDDYFIARAKKAVLKYGR